MPMILAVSRGIWRQVSYTTYMLLKESSEPSVSASDPNPDFSINDNEEFYLEGSDDENGDGN